MAHKALIGGTEYAIKGGRTLVGGTVYNIKVGNTLVGGTNYKLTFTSLIAVTITGSGTANQQEVNIGGTVYTSAADGIEVEPGSVIRLTITGYSNPFTGEDCYSELRFSGDLIISAYDTESYDLIVPEWASSILIEMLRGGPLNNCIGINVTMS